jgi:hypothetical protein
MKYEVGEFYQTKMGSVLKLVKADRTLWFKRIYGQDFFICSANGLIAIICDTEHKFKKLDNKKVLEVLYGN